MLGDDAGTKALVTLLHAAKSDHRGALICGLGWIKSAISAEALTALLSDESGAASRAAVQALVPHDGNPNAISRSMS